MQEEQSASTNPTPTPQPEPTPTPTPTPEAEPAPEPEPTPAPAQPSVQTTPAPEPEPATEPSDRSKLRFLFLIPILLQAVTSTMLVIALFRIGLLQTWQTAIVGALLLFLLLLNAYKLILSKRAGVVVKVISVILAILVSAVSIFGFKYLNQTISFIESMTGTHNETMIYQVRVLKDSSYKNISQLKNQHVGFLSTNPNLENAKNILKNSVDYKDKDYDEIGSMIAAIYDYKIAALVINQSYSDFIEETDSKFIDESIVIYDFKVTVEAPDDPQAAAVDVKTDPFLLYVSGSDSRGDISETSRSDVNIVAAINPETFNVLLVNIPRDYYVQLHGTSGYKDKLTHAGIYGINMSKTTIEDLLDVKINHTVKLGFKTLTKVVDTIDGIDINSDRAFKSGNCSFVKGKQHINAECALAYARERHAYESGDRHRGQNQQEIIAAIISKVTDPHYLVRYSKILEAAQGSFETSLTYDEITGFARYQLSALRTWKVENISLDGTGAMMPTYSMGSQLLYVMEPDMRTVTNAQQKLKQFLK